jgi:Fe-S oxidoreductase
VEGADRAGARRIDEAVATGARTVVTGCPYCHQMLGDAAKLRNVDKSIRVQDLATVLARSLEAGAETPPAPGSRPVP